MKKNIVVAGIAVIVAAGCSSIGRQQPPKTVFDFGPPAERVANSVAPAGVALEVRAPTWIDSPRISYRLAYQDIAERREYAESRWAGAAGALLAQRLRQRLGVGTGGGRCVLRLTVDEFGQVFDAPDKSRGVLRVEVQLFDSNGRIAAQFAVGSEAPSATADARGGVAALRAALDRSSVSLNEWLGGSAVKAALSGCAG